MTAWRRSMNWRSELEALVEAVPPDQMPDLIGELALASAVLNARLVAVPASNPDGRGEKAAEPDRLIDVKDAAVILKVEVSWLYRHAKALPFTRRLGRKQLRFSEIGIQRWMATRR